MNIVSKVSEAVSAVCPIDGVSIGRKNDKETWRIDFKDEATAQQRVAAQAVVESFDVAAAEAKEITDENAARVKMRLADIDLKTVRALREYVASKVDAPQVIKDHEAAAVFERAKLRGNGTSEGGV